MHKAWQKQPVPHLPTPPPHHPTFFCPPAGGKQTKLSLVTGTSRERESDGETKALARLRAAGQIIFFVLCGKCFYFAFLYIFFVYACCLSGKARGVCLSAIFPLILSRFVACFIHLFFIVFLYFMPCLLAGMCVCVSDSDR